MRRLSKQIATPKLGAGPQFGTPAAPHAQRHRNGVFWGTVTGDVFSMRQRK